MASLVLTQLTPPSFISGTHTHSAPAGFIQYTLYQITSAGFSKEVMNAYVEGISQSILRCVGRCLLGCLGEGPSFPHALFVSYNSYRAFNNLEVGTIRMAKDLLFDANINRSPTSYLLNPQSERDEYASEGDTDKSMLQLIFSSSKQGSQQPKGILNWFPVHGTSMNVSNLVSAASNVSK